MNCQRSLLSYECIQRRARTNIRDNTHGFWFVGKSQISIFTLLAHSRRFRIKYDKIVAFEPYSDGIGVQRDAVTAKPQSFVTDDGWITYNLITNLAQM